MKITVETADFLESYLQSWTEGVIDAHWFHSTSIFGYIREEMIEEIKKEFNQHECIHLLAKHKSSDKVVGALKVKIQNDMGTFGRWDPTVPVKYRESGVGEALTEKAFELLHERNATRARCIIKFPYNQPKKANWHIKIYQKCEFILSRPRSILLQGDLSNADLKAPAITDLHLVNGDDFSLEDLADFTQRAFLSTTWDRQIHGSDPTISSREIVLKILEAIKNGKMGLSPPELWRVAKIEDDIAGFIIAFIPQKSKYRPLFGVIGELGVFPEYRRKGIATSLIAEVLKAFKEHGCSYSLVGTPKANEPALKLYAKIGYTPAFEQLDFEKKLA